VEIGGWRRKFVTQNPPPELLEEECALQMPWILYLAKESPFLTMSQPEIRALGEDRFEVEVRITNTGYLPTNLTERGMEAQVVKPVYASISIDEGVLLNGGKRLNLGHLAGRYPVPDTSRESSAVARWTVQTTSPNATIQIEASSEKGGVVRTEKLRLIK
jgi:hypothetical protein